MNVYVVFNRLKIVGLCCSWLLLNCPGVYIYLLYIRRFCMWRVFSDLGFRVGDVTWERRTISTYMQMFMSWCTGRDTNSDLKNEILIIKIR